MNFFKKKDSQAPRHAGVRAVLSGRETALFLDDSPDSLPRALGLALAGQRAAAWLDDDGLLASVPVLRQAAKGHVPLVAHAGLRSHAPYHAASHAGCFQFFARDVQEAADLALVARRTAELSLVPGIVAQDSPWTDEALASVRLPGPELIAEYLGSPEDEVTSPTAAQNMVFGPKRRRLPEPWSFDRPLVSGADDDRDSGAARIAADRPFFADHVAAIADKAMNAFAEMTGRTLSRLVAYRVDGADYLIVAQGEAASAAEAVADRLSDGSGGSFGVVRVTMLRPFPGKELAALLRDRKGVLVLERLDQPLSIDTPLTREVRAAAGKGLEGPLPPVYTALYGLGGRAPRPRDIAAAAENMLPDGAKARTLYIGPSFTDKKPLSPKAEIEQQAVLDSYPELPKLSAPAAEQDPDLLPEGSVVVRVSGSGVEDTGRALTERLAGLGGGHLHTSSGAPRSYYQLVLASAPIKTASTRAEADLLIVFDPSKLDVKSVSRVREAGSVVAQGTDPEKVYASVPAPVMKTAIDRGLQLYAGDIRGKAGLDPVGLILGCMAALLKDSKLLDLGSDPWKAALREPSVKKISGSLAELKKRPQLPADEAAPVPMPAALKGRPSSPTPAADLHRFYTAVGHRYASGARPRVLADPFVGSGLLPAATGVLKDESRGRERHPELIASKCTGCGACWTVCPDSALPARVNGFDELCETAAAKMESEGRAPKRLAKAVRSLASEMDGRLGSGGASFAEHLQAAAKETLSSSGLSGAERDELDEELKRLVAELRGLPVVVTELFFKKGEGGLLSLPVDPDRCQGCMACVKACPEAALKPAAQTAQTLKGLRKDLAFCSRLPDTDARHIRDAGDEADEKPYESLLLDRQAYESMVGGSGGAPGSGARSALHILTAAATAVRRRRIAAHLTRLDELTEKLAKHMKEKLAVDVEDTGALNAALDELKAGAFTLKDLAGKMDPDKEPVDADFVRRTAWSLSTLRARREALAGGNVHLGAVACGEKAAPRFPHHPYAFPCVRLGRGMGPETAMGLYEGFMRGITDWFKAVRIAELELEGKYNPRTDDARLEHFCWRDLTAEEMALCPPLVVVGESEDLYGGALSRLLKSGMPVKVLVLDGPQTPPYRPILDIAHQDAYVLQGSIADTAHLLRGIADGIASARPAVFHVFCSPATGDGAAAQARLALESRAAPLLRYDPSKGAGLDERLDLEGNPEPGEDWAKRPLSFTNDEGKEESLEDAYTFGAFAATEESFRREFTGVPRPDWTDAMAPLEEFIGMDADERAESVPFAWSTGSAGRLERLAVSGRVVRLTEERLAVWKLLKHLKRMDAAKVDEGEIADRVRTETVEKVTRSLMNLVGGAGQDGAALASAFVEKAAGGGS